MNQVYKHTDVLVIGGGLAGCWAAIRAKEFVPKVTLVDKAVISRSGASSWAYYLLAPPPEKDLSIWKQELVEKGDYLNNQEWIDVLLKEHGQRLTDMESWGAPFERDKNGKLLVKAGRGHKSTGFVTSDARTRMEVLKKKAREAGVDIIERVMITDLLTSDGRLPTSGCVIGATGFNTRTGEIVVIKSKSVIIASGPIYHQGSNLSGDGIAMAFRAGAELTGMEFCTHPSCHVSDGKQLLISLNVLFQSLGIRIFNSKGERFMEKYSPVLKERSDWSLLSQAIARESSEGRGPAILDMSEARDEDIEHFARLHPGKFLPLQEAKLDLKKDKLQVVPLVKVSSTSGDGGILIDIECRTNIPGLYGAGSACKNQVHGTYSVGGINLAFCCTSGYRAGESAAADSLKAKDLQLNDEQVGSLQRAAFSALKREKGPRPLELFKKIAEITAPPMVSIIKRGDRIKQTIADLKDFEEKELETVVAKDYHELVKANGAKNLALLSGLVFRSALEREESRHSHYRQEFPYRDDLNWLKWVIIRRDANRQIRVTTKPLPFEQWQVKPQKRGLVPSAIKL